MDALLAPYAGIIKAVKIVFNYFWGEWIAWYDLIVQNDLLPSLMWLGFITLLIWIYLMSGFIAATISECRNRAPMPHFILGLLLPGIYPALINGMLSNLVAEQAKDELIGEKEKQHSMTVDLTARLMHVAHQEYKPTDLKLDEDGNEIVEEKHQEAEVLPCDHAFFSKIALKHDGTPAGPFVVNLSDGRIVEADFILEVLDDVVIFQINTSTGNPRKVRLAFKLITACAVKQA